MYSINERVGASKTGVNGLMTLVGALNSIQDCSLFWLESEPEFHKFLIENNMGIFIASRQVDIVRMPGYAEKITITTIPYECTSYLGYRNTAIYGSDGLPCVLTYNVGAFVHLESGKMAKLPKEVINSLTIDNKLDMEYLDKKIELPDIEGKRFEPVAVKPTYIDLYHHMNNSRYVEEGLNIIPEHTQIKRLRIEYKTPAKLGDLLYPKLLKDSDKQYVLLSDSSDNPYAVMELS